MQGASSSEDEAAAVVLRGLSKRSAKGSSRTGVNSIRRAKAEKWFHDINRNVASARNATFYDNDPPFYLHQRSSTNSSSDIGHACAILSERSFQTKTRSSHSRRGYSTRSFRSRMESSGSTSEELRSVIDDLTVTNKKLRQKLKVYDRLHCSHLQEEKLFEVRIHGLPSHKRGEFERTLRGFASSLEVPSSRQTPLQSHPSPSKQKLRSSSTSGSKPVDSAYASQSTSGQVANSHAYRDDAKSFKGPKSRPASKTRNTKMRYHDMPRSLLPQRPAFMSEKTKQKTVVRRLERIFTGRCASSARRSRSLQRLEETEPAASNDVQDGEGGGRGFDKMGMREAQILSAGNEIPTESWIDPDSCGRSRDMDHGDDLGFYPTLSRSNTNPDQRPTRPLDLDLCRAQVSAENINYIRHLGLASPERDSSDNCDPADGWVYLNMLANLAQLHTLSVTPDFIRKSIANVSSQFELSDDGQKIRWKGGSKGTLMSSDSEDSVEPNSDLNDTSDASMNNLSMHVGDRVRRRPVMLDQPHNETSFHYRPLFYQDSCSDDEYDNLYVHDEGDDGSPVSSRSANLKTGAGSDSKDQNPGASVTSQNKIKESGPIIFYNKAKFCTDLSRDPNRDVGDYIIYNRYVDQPIGQNQPPGLKKTVYQEVENDEVRSSKLAYVRGGLNDATLTNFDLGLETMNITDSRDFSHGVAPVYMEVSGLGGVQPQDNFVINVETQYRKSENSSLNSPYLDELLYNMPKPHIDAIRTANPAKRRTRFRDIETRVLSAVTTTLPPSVLPEPSYICLPFSSDNEDDDDDDDYSIESSEENVDKKLPRLSLSDDDDDDENDIKEHPTPLDSPLGSPGHGSEKNSFASNLNESDDSSIDLLAHARFLDPDAIAAREREFDINVEQIHKSSSSARGASGLVDTSSSEGDRERTRGSVKRRRIGVDNDIHLQRFVFG